MSKAEKHNSTLSSLTMKSEDLEDRIVTKKEAL